MLVGGYLVVVCLCRGAVRMAVRILLLGELVVEVRMRLWRSGMMVAL